MIELLNKNEFENDLELDFGVVEESNNGLVDILIMQRNFRYDDCILLGNYNPVKGDKGIIILVSKAKYSCFIPLFFVNNSQQNVYKDNDIIINSKGDYEADITKLEPEFLKEVSNICNRLNINETDLLLVMNFESKFNAQAKNPNSTAVGLIQFIEETAIKLGTTIEQLLAMNRIQQLEYVEKYLKPYSGKLKNLQDICMSIFYPIYIGESSDKIFPESVQKVNKGIVRIQDYVNLVLSHTRRKTGLLQISGDGTIKIEH